MTAYRTCTRYQWPVLAISISSPGGTSVPLVSVHHPDPEGGPRSAAGSCYRAVGVSTGCRAQSWGVMRGRTSVAFSACPDASGAVVDGGNCAGGAAESRLTPTPTAGAVGKARPRVRSMSGHACRHAFPPPAPCRPRIAASRSPSGPISRRGPRARAEGQAGSLCAAWQSQRAPRQAPETRGSPHPPTPPAQARRRGSDRCQ